MNNLKKPFISPNNFDKPMIIIVRHGQTDSNLNRRFQGQLDIPLNQTGLMQSRQSAEVVASILQQLPPVLLKSCRILSSDLARASQTAEALQSRLDIKLEFSKHLREQHTGMLQGHTLEEFHAKHSALAVNYERDLEKNPYEVRPPGEGAESKLDVAVRLSKFIDATLDPLIKSGKPSLQIWCSHGWTINTLFDLLSIQFAAPEAYIGNGDVAVVGLNPGVGARTELANKFSIASQWQILDHTEVGERIGSLSFIRKVA